jgi:hypothetical protein
MKYAITLALLFFNLFIFAQKPCEYSADVKDSLGTYKSTKEQIVYEKNFAGNSSYIFCSLNLVDGMPTLNVQHIQKSKSFIKANCFDKNSKLYLQLSNGKIITLLHIDQESCGSLIRDPKGFDNRINIEVFMFLKDTFEDLKSAPVSLMRLQSLTQTEDYVFVKELKSELNNVVYEPENFFVTNLKCIEVK